MFIPHLSPYGKLLYLCFDFLKHEQLAVLIVVSFETHKRVKGLSTRD